MVWWYDQTCSTVVCRPPKGRKRKREKKETATSGWPCSSVFLSSVVRDVIHDSYVSDGNSSPFESNNFSPVRHWSYCVRPSRGGKLLRPRPHLFALLPVAFFCLPCITTTILNMTIGSVLLAPSPSGGKTYDLMYYLKGAAAGGICCSITHGALTPVDVVKTRVQLDPVKVG